MKDITGQKFGRLTAIRPTRKDEKRRTYFWYCCCECGKTLEIRLESLTTGNTKSCGCYNKEILLKHATKHGHCQHRLYKRWKNMMERCYKVLHPDYNNYGGRGIDVSDEWKNFDSFSKDMDESFMDNMTLDRIDNDKGYSKENCRWATPKEQGNNRRTNKILTYNNESKTLSEWSSFLGIPKHVIWNRLHQGWSVDKAIQTPYKSYNTTHKKEVLNDSSN